MGCRYGYGSVNRAVLAAVAVENGSPSACRRYRKIATLEAQLAAARAEARDVAKARAGIVGSVVVDAMKENPEFARGVVALLKAKVRSARDKALIADLLVTGAST